MSAPDPISVAPGLLYRPFATEKVKGAHLVANGVVRATFVGDVDDPRDRAALLEMVRELFGDDAAAAIESNLNGDLT